MKQILIVAAVLIMFCVMVNAQIYRVAQMNTEQIRALDKQKTVVILTGGILEQHGPHLPSYTDTYVNEWVTERLAEALAERPGWSVLIFPTIPLGYGAANVIGEKYTFPGSYTVSKSTIRAVYMDLATELGEQGFRWIFINHGHGAPYNNLALDQVGEYFRDTYGGIMVHLRGLEPTAGQLLKARFTSPFPQLTQAETKENGKLDPHAGFEETSVMLFLRPDLVSPFYKTLAPLTVNKPADQFALARSDNWLGYLGSPRIGNAAYGARRQQWRAALNIALVNAFLDRILDERDIPRYSTITLSNPEFTKNYAGRANYEAQIERKQREWLKKKGIE
ncbi:MAG: creatininase family protein [Acidobacteriota bacterium]|nr:creatininase family protein [Acidobacteriota bacterium]